MMRKTFLSVIVTILFFGCAATSAEEIAFSTLARGYHASGIDDGFEVVIYDDDSFSSLWGDIAEGITPLPTAPRVDFESEMVIAVSPGPQPTGGYGVEIVDIEDLGEVLRVIVTFRVPGPEDFVTEAITQPYHIVSTERREVPVEFVWE